MSVHSLAGLGNIHTPFAWIFPDKATRLSCNTSLADEGKLAFEQKTNTLWQLVSHNPIIWEPVGGHTGEGFFDVLFDRKKTVTKTIYNTNLTALSLSFVPSQRPLVFFDAEVVLPQDNHLYRAVIHLNDEELRVIAGKRGRQNGALIFSGMFSFDLELGALYELSVGFQNTQGNVREVALRNCSLIVLGANNA